jgi:hypothetical protein
MQALGRCRCVSCSAEKQTKMQMLHILPKMINIISCCELDHKYTRIMQDMEMRRIPYKIPLYWKCM